jgi:hypothetical protein
VPLSFDSTTFAAFKKSQNLSRCRRSHCG